ncbi:MAG TPA: cardiolipin synthase ClsB [Methylophilus sp.]
MTNYINGNQIELLRGGSEYFPALEAAIAEAQHTVFVQTYIFELDTSGLRIGLALQRAAMRGVHVHLMLDGFGCKGMSKAYIKTLATAGVEVMFYRPKISPWTFKKNRLRRLHRKIAVVDGRVAFVGGINIIDDFNIPDHSEPQHQQPRIDYAVRLEGALLPSIEHSTRKLWFRMSRLFLQPMHYRKQQPKPLAALAGEGRHVKAAFVLRDNFLHRRDIEEAYLEAIQHAKQEIIIANAYFLPGRRFRQALVKASKRGVKVSLYLQGSKSQHVIMFANYAFYHYFLANHIQIFEYRKSEMHCKVAVIDEHWATVGSSNIDPFSMLLANEANIIVLDNQFALALRTEITHAIQAHALPISLKDWSNAGVIKRFFSWLMYGLVRLLLGLIGRFNHH